MVTVTVAIGSGPFASSPATVAQIIGHRVLGWPETVMWEHSAGTIVWLVRLPRVLLLLTVLIMAVLVALLLTYHLAATHQAARR